MRYTCDHLVNRILYIVNVHVHADGTTTVELQCGNLSLANTTTNASSGSFSLNFFTDNKELNAQLAASLYDSRSGNCVLEIITPEPRSPCNVKIPLADLREEPIIIIG